MPQSPEYRVIRERNVMVPMRDGVRLATDVYRPDSPGRFPVLVTRGPYGKDGYADNQEHSIWFFPQRGYAVVSQDCRGRFESEGEYNPLFQEGLDGYDTVEWAARQPWSNGRVATTGQSYLGATQYTLAGTNPLPPHLQTMIPVSASSDFHQSWVYHTGGAMEWGWTVPYAIHKGRNTLERAGRRDLLARMDEYVLEPDNFAQPLRDSWYRHLPLRDWIDRLKETAPYFSEYFDQEPDGPYWWEINLLRHIENINLPMFHVSSWYDIFLEGALNTYQAMRERAPTAQARNNQKLLVGPWAHIRPYTAPTSGDTGDIDFGPEARIELHEHMLRWYDYWLKDIQTGIMEESPVSIFVMGENRWRAENEWPLARTHYTRYYFHADTPANTRSGAGTLSTAPPGDEPADSYVYDPDDPAPTLRGSTLIIPHGVQDQRSVEDRQDVLVYTSDPSGAGPGNHRPHQGAFVRRQHRRGHRLHRQAGGRPSRRIRPQPPGRHHPRPVPHLRGPAVAHRAGAGLRVRNRPVVDKPLGQGRPPPAGRDFKQQLPPVRPQPQHRRAHRPGHPHGDRPADRPPLHGPPLPHRPARHTPISEVSPSE